MQVNFAPLFSGSSGNALYLEMGGDRVLIDAGLSGVRVSKELERFRVRPESIAGMLITHEHSDHVQGVGVLARRYHLPVYATRGTWEGMSGRVGAIDAGLKRTVCAGEALEIGHMRVTPFHTPHDAFDPVGYVFQAGDCKVAIATDIGHVCESWLTMVEHADILLLESNHDIGMLSAGNYPYDLKRRILGENGHLSNDDAGRAVALLAKRGVRHIILGHLSAENNFPELALRTVSDALDMEGLNGAVGLDIARRGGANALYHLDDEEAHARNG